MAIPWKEQYAHPLWQKKRLEALEGAAWSCEECGDKEMTLHVHHKRYVKGRNVWEYSLEELEVLCQPCHEERHYLKDQVADFFVRTPPDTHPEILQLMRGYINTTTGPFFSDSYAREEDQESYWLGVMAGALSMLYQRRVAVLQLLIKASEKDLALATGFRDDLRRAVEWFEKPKD